MSRHRLVKNLDLDDELDDYDGEDDYYEEGGAVGGEELSEEDQELMASGTIAVREALGVSAKGITDKEIQEALWHYYYDVGKSVSYLLNTRVPKESKAKNTGGKKLNGGSPFLPGSSMIGSRQQTVCDASGRNRMHLGLGLDPTTAAEASKSCTGAFSVKDFFKDMPWLNTPVDRHTTFIEPLYPRGGLLGGSSDGAPKMTKLQALAAARKKKAQEQKSSSGDPGMEKAISKLSVSDSTTRPSSVRQSSAKAEVSTQSTSADASKLRSYRARARPGSESKDQDAQTQPQPQPPPTVEILQSERTTEQSPPTVVEEAEPSAFANIMFGAGSPHQSHGSLFVLPYTAHLIGNSTDAFAEPSPDDVVIAAQSKAKNLGGKTPKATAKKTDKLASGVESMQIDDTPKAISKNLNVLEEYEKTKKKKAANFVVIGHVDAGKSTLMGRLLFDLKVVDQRTIEKYRKEAERMGKSSFALAWVLDQGAEERSRGVTIDIASNKFETAETAFTILDAPGHRDFIPNMIAGASQADFAVLVIDASTGSFESGLKGQTKEHALLVRSMGVQRIIVAVNKLDTVGWSQSRYDEISQQISSFLTAAGFQSKNLSFVPLSGLNGDNVTRRIEDPAASWYTGPTLVEELDKSEPVARALEKPLRMTIDNIFRGGVQNPLSVAGRLDSGSIQVGDALLAQPSGEKCYIKGLELENQAADWAVAGQNVTIHLSGIDPMHLKVGDVLCTPASPIKNIKSFTAKVLAFEFILPSKVDVHRGRLHAAGSITQITATLDKSSGAVTKKKPKIVKPGSIARVVVELDASVPLEAPSRVVLRSNGETVAAGLIE